MDGFRKKLVELFGKWIIEDIETIEDWLGNEIEVIPKTYMKNDRASRKFDGIELGLRGKPTHRKFRPIIRKENLSFIARSVVRNGTEKRNPPS